MIGKQRSQLHKIGWGDAQCRLPCDFPVKSGSWISFINVGIRFLMCSGKPCCVPDFGDFCSRKRNFGVGKYGGCANLLFIITKPSTIKWAYTDCNTLTYTITRHTVGLGDGVVGYFAVQGDKS